MCVGSVCVCVCLYDKIRLVLRNCVQKLKKNPRVIVRISLYTGKCPVVHSRKHFHPNKCISLWLVYRNVVNCLFPCNARPVMQWYLLRHTGIPELWTQELYAGLWMLDSGRWILDAGRWTLDAGLWILDSGRSTLDSGHWTLDSGRWTLDVSLIAQTTI